MAALASNHSHDRTIARRAALTSVLTQSGTDPNSTAIKLRGTIPDGGSGAALLLGLMRGAAPALGSIGGKVGTAPRGGGVVFARVGWASGDGLVTQPAKANKALQRLSLSFKFIWFEPH